MIDMSHPILILTLNILIALGIYRFGRVLAGPARITPIKSSTYASGEKPPEEMTAPGYRPFFTLALFFVVLHLGALVIGTAIATTMPLLYLAGISITLLALVLG